MRNRGFTLLEALVALAILAVCLSAGLRAVGATAQSTANLRDSTLGDWVARNRLAELRASAAFPNPGRSQGESEQAGRRYRWIQVVSSTANPLFRKVEVRVVELDSGRPVGSLMGFLAKPL